MGRMIPGENSWNVYILNTAVTILLNGVMMPKRVALLPVFASFSLWPKTLEGTCVYEEHGSGQ